MQPDGEDKKKEPKLLHKIERVMIHRIAEMPDNDPGKKHTGSPEPDPAKLNAPERHPQNANKSQRPDRVRDRLKPLLEKLKLKR